jgi:hypothetical protein
MSQRLQAVIAHAEDLLCCPQPQPTKKQELRLGAHAPHSSAIRPLRSGKMMAGHREHSRRLRIRATLSFGYVRLAARTVAAFNSAVTQWLSFASYARLLICKSQQVGGSFGGRSMITIALLSAPLALTLVEFCSAAPEPPATKPRNGIGGWWTERNVISGQTSSSPGKTWFGPMTPSNLISMKVQRSEANGTTRRRN